MNKKQLQKKIESLKDALAQIEDTELQKRLPLIRKQLLNTYWKTRNNYSCPEKESDYWTLYFKVVEIDHEGHVYCAQVQTDKDGNMTIEPHRYNYNSSNFEGRYIPASKEEFDSACIEIIKKISSL